MVKALFVHGARDLRLGEIDVAAPQAGEVLVDIARGGICGSDLSYFKNGGFGTVRVREPMVLGHEVSGHVAQVGEGVTGLQVGDLVAVSPSRPCGNCVECLRGLPNECLNMRFYGSAMPFPHIQGAFRSQLVAKAENCIPAQGLSAGEAAMAEPLAVVLHAVRQAGVMMGARVLITGCGPIGVLAILAARRAGAGEIIVTDIADRVLDIARDAGADVTLNTATNPDALAPYAQGKGSLDIHFECSGAEQALASGIAALRPRGRIVQLGLSGDMKVPMMQLTAKELTVTGSFRFHEEFAVAVGMMQRKLIDVNSLITHDFKVEDFQAAFEMALDRSQSMKVQLAFS